jgi:hypothetical protein
MAHDRRMSRASPEEDARLFSFELQKNHALPQVGYDRQDQLDSKAGRHRIREDEKEKKKVEEW